MLDGITVLNEYPIMDYVFNWQLGFFIGMAALIGIFVCLTLFELADWLPSIAVSLVVGIMFFFAFGGIFSYKVPTSAKGIPSNY